MCQGYRYGPQHLRQIGSHCLDSLRSSCQNQTCFRYIDPLTNHSVLSDTYTAKFRAIASLNESVGLICLTFKYISP